VLLLVALEKIITDTEEMKNEANKSAYFEGGKTLRKYETVIVIDSLLKQEEIENIISKYEQFISDNGGKIDTIDRWGKKRLAYEIKKRQYGYYVLIRFDAPPTLIKQLTREYRLNEALLRYMTLKLSKNALKALEARQTAAPKAEEAPASIPETDKLEEDETPESFDSETSELAIEQEAEEAETAAEEVDEPADEPSSETADEVQEDNVQDQESTSEGEAEEQKEA